MFLIKEGQYDTEEKLYKSPPKDVEPNGDDPKVAKDFAATHGLRDDETIIKVFTPNEKYKLQKMIKHKEFNNLESAVLNALMVEVLNLDQLGEFLGSVSPKTKGKPMSRPATLKELNRILGVVAKRSKFEIGKSVDLSQIPKLKRQAKVSAAKKRKIQKEEARKRRELMREFWQTLKELNDERRKHGLKPISYKMFEPQEFNQEFNYDT